MQFINKKKFKSSTKKLHIIDLINSSDLPKMQNIYQRNANWEKYGILLELHTYIIGHYNPSIRIIDPVSHTTYVVCVNFIHKWRDLQV